MINWDEQLHSGIKKELVISLALAAIKSNRDTDSLIAAISHRNKIISRKAAWVVSTIAEMDCSRLASYIPVFLAIIRSSNDSSVLRELLKIFLLMPTTESTEGQLIHDCFRLLMKSDSDLAVRYTSMRLIIRSTQNHPELKRELDDCISAIMPQVSGALQRQMKKYMDGKG